MSLKTLRKSIEQNCDIIQAVLSFNYRYTPLTRNKLQEIRASLPDSTTRELEHIEAIVKEDARRFAEQFGCLFEPAQFARTFIEACAPGNGIPLVSKATVDTLYFSNFSGDGAWLTFSPHLLLQVHCDWVVIPGKPFAFRYHLPEATLFEDMAFAYNLALEIDPHFDSDGNAEGDTDLKRRSFYFRTAVLSAFYFVEAFLNGMAFDFYYRNSASVSEEDRAFLLEEPGATGRGGFVSFEKKVTQYLKVILGTPHPPLSASNCAPLKFMLTEAKELRDSIVH